MMKILESTTRRSTNTSTRRDINAPANDYSNINNSAVDGDAFDPHDDGSNDDDGSDDETPGAIAVPGMNSPRQNHSSRRRIRGRIPGQRRSNNEHAVDNRSTDDTTFDNLLVDPSENDQNEITSSSRRDPTTPEVSASTSTSGSSGRMAQGDDPTIEIVEAELTVVDSHDSDHNPPIDENEIRQQILDQVEQEIREQVQQELFQSIPRAEVLSTTTTGDDNSRTNSTERSHQEEQHKQQWDHHNQLNNQTTVMTKRKLPMETLGLYGRETQQETLKSILNRPIKQQQNVAVEERKSKTEQRQLVLIHGVSGCGKTVIVETYVRNIVENELKGVYVLGKFEFGSCYDNDDDDDVNLSSQHAVNNKPYSVISTVTRQICQQILNSTFGRQINTIRERIQECLHITEIDLLSHCIPEIKDFIHHNDREDPFLPLNNDDEGHGQDSSISNIYIDGQAKIKFLNAFCIFLRILSSHVAPLVIVLDDLQWCDSASFELIEKLVLHDEPQQHRDQDMIIIGLYRSNYETHTSNNHSAEIFVNRDLTEFVNRMKEWNDNEEIPLCLTELHVGNLTISTIHSLLMDLLEPEQSPPEGEGSKQTMDLAELCHKRTNGNPFFLSKFLESLNNHGWLEFDFVSGGWKWDIQQLLLKTSATENVAELLKQKISDTLFPGSSRLMTIAACLGHTFDVATLKLVVSHLDEDTDSVGEIGDICVYTMKIATQEGFVEPLPVDGDRQFRFVHDKVQEACLSLVQDDVVLALKRRIGWTLCSNLDHDALDSNLYLVLELLDGSTPDQEESRLQLAKLYLQAAENAWGMTAFSASSKHSVKGLRYLPTEPYSNDLYRDVALRLNSVGAKAALYVGDTRTSERCTNDVIQSNCSIREKIRCYETQMTALSQNSQPAESMKLALHLLTQLGCHFPTREPCISLNAFFALAKTNFTKNVLYSIDPMKLPMVTDGLLIEKCDIIDGANGDAYFAGWITIYLLTTIRVVHWTIKHGIVRQSPHFFCNLGLLFMHFLGDWDTGCRCAELGQAMMSRFTNPRTLPEVMMVGHSSVLSWRYSISSRLSYLRQGYEIGAKVGDLECATYDFALYASMMIVSESP